MEREALYKRLRLLQEVGLITEKYYQILKDFFLCYEQELKKSALTEEQTLALLDLFIQKFTEHLKKPVVFPLYHKKVESPFDYYRFSLDFLRPLVNRERSKIVNLDLVATMQEQLHRGENVIFFANHQSESDPQILSLMLEDSFPAFGKKIMYIAGERVITDPFAIPFSLGCDLLCIYSKRYINTPPEKKEQKQLHNRRVMESMSQLLAEGGKVIYVAPSGGRDRRNQEGNYVVAPFDASSIEMFYLMAKKARKPTHFYPLSLLTYALMPPPETIQEEMGERRSVARTPIGVYFGKEIAMENIPIPEGKSRIEAREERAKAIYRLVETNYNQLKKSIEA